MSMCVEPCLVDGADICFVCVVCVCVCGGWGGLVYMHARLCVKLGVDGCLSCAHLISVVL